jgi:hypothetical protein
VIRIRGESVQIAKLTFSLKENPLDFQSLDIHSKPDDLYFSERETGVPLRTPALIFSELFAETRSKQTVFDPCNAVRTLNGFGVYQSTGE